MQRNTLKIGGGEAGPYDDHNMREHARRVSPFYNPKFFDQRFDKLGNFLPKEEPQKPLSRASKRLNRASVSTINDQQDETAEEKLKPSK